MSAAFQIYNVQCHKTEKRNHLRRWEWGLGATYNFRGIIDVGKQLIEIESERKNETLLSFWEFKCRSLQHVISIWTLLRKKFKTRKTPWIVKSRAAKPIATYITKNRPYWKWATARNEEMKEWQMKKPRFLLFDRTSWCLYRKVAASVLLGLSSVL